jgi:prepilin-type N-terminal cleavage/methylation domain-containing protein
MNKITDNNRGFTLIEAVISLGVLSIGILALFAMQTLSIRGNASASGVTTLATWGGDEIEQMLTQNYDVIQNTDFLPCPSDGTVYRNKRTVLENTPIEDIKTIEVAVIKCVDGKTDGKQVKLKYLKYNKI